MEHNSARILQAEKCEDRYFLLLCLRIVLLKSQRLETKRQVLFSHMCFFFYLGCKICKKGENVVWFFFFLLKCGTHLKKQGILKKLQ